MGVILSVRQKRILKEFYHRRIIINLPALTPKGVKCIYFDLGHALRLLQRGKATAQGLLMNTTGSGLAGAG
jgi:hypothetical protein